MTHDPNNKECEATCDSECNQAHTHFDENDCTCPPEKKEDWESTKEWSELSDAIEEIEWDSDDHYDGKIFVIETLKDFIRSQISIARQEEREKMSTFLKEGEDHINALIALAESRARKEVLDIVKAKRLKPRHIECWNGKSEPCENCISFQMRDNVLEDLIDEISKL